MKREMDEDINWGSLFLKVIIFFVIVLIIIWLFSKFVLKKTNDKNSTSEFDKNLNSMYNVAEKYFNDETKLPKPGESSTLTLKEMKDLGLIDTLKDGKTICSNKSSYSKVTNTNGEYTLKVLLTCGSNSNFISKVIKKSEIKSDEKTSIENENNNSNDTSESNTNNNSRVIDNSNENSSNTSNNNSNYNTSKNDSTNSYDVGSSNNSTVTETIDKSYENTEFKFCKIGYSDYYTVVYFKKQTLDNIKKFKYSIVLSDLSNVSNITIIDNNYFTTINYYKNFMNKKNNYEVVNGNNTFNIIERINNVNTLSKSSLKVTDFNYDLSDIYEENGKYLIDVIITLKNTNKPAYKYGNYDILFVPLYIKTSYAKLDDCVTDKITNRSKYSTYYVVR